MQIRLIILLSIGVYAAGCSTLTKIQSKAISNFAGSVNNFSSIPPKINDSYYQC